VAVVVAAPDRRHWFFISTTLGTASEARGTRIRSLVGGPGSRKRVSRRQPTSTGRPRGAGASPGRGLTRLRRPEIARPLVTAQRRGQRRPGDRFGGACGIRAPQTFYAASPYQDAVSALHREVAVFSRERLQLRRIVNISGITSKPRPARTKSGASRPSLPRHHVPLPRPAQAEASERPFSAR